MHCNGYLNSLLKSGLVLHVYKKVTVSTDQ